MSGDDKINPFPSHDQRMRRLHAALEVAHLASEERIYTFPSREEVMRRLRSALDEPMLVDTYYAHISEQLAGAERYPRGLASMLLFYQDEALRRGMPASLLPTIRIYLLHWIQVLVGDDPIFNIEAKDALMHLLRFIEAKAAEEEVEAEAETPPQDTTDDYQVYLWTRRAVDIFFELTANAPAGMELDVRPSEPHINSRLNQTASGLIIVTTTQDYTPDVIVTRWGHWRFISALGYTGTFLPLASAYLSRLGAIHMGDPDEYTQVWGISQIDTDILPTARPRTKRRDFMPGAIAEAKWDELTERYAAEKGEK